VYGADRPGIVHAVARVLAAFGVNVTDMTTQVVGPGPGRVRHDPRGRHPEAVDLKELDGAFDRIRQGLSVSISMRPVDPVEL
jgi:glycine cleavage system regulatory protein